ncbi:hypothetical protein [Roseibium alexandrii]|uniref:Uncharacterized protein n=1 Tax=Roseibium alexandrii (strain DSM 17067 / NCIMB 14079 / DFL-11) TaxID=244592 RepID=A0A5E8GSJ5_ROSAD|nr:hypothetical protein [Roseibium alexandrii]EEE42856.1 hypothetical protein SADFL11_PLAS28 [Roseibium alexandrii DFL-11]
MKVSIGWVARSKPLGGIKGNSKCDIAVYQSHATALRYARGRTLIDPEKPPLWTNYRRETDEEVLAKYDILEAFVEVPDES